MGLTDRPRVRRLLDAGQLWRAAFQEVGLVYQDLARQHERGTSMWIVAIAFGPITEREARSFYRALTGDEPSDDDITFPLGSLVATVPAYDASAAFSFATNTVREALAKADVRVGTFQVGVSSVEDAQARYGAESVPE